MACYIWNSLVGRGWGHRPGDKGEPPRLRLSKRRSPRDCWEERDGKVEQVKTSESPLQSDLETKGEQEQAASEGKGGTSGQKERQVHKAWGVGGNNEQCGERGRGPDAQGPPWGAKETCLSVG